jgi:hypothetical protein
MAQPLGRSNSGARNDGCTSRQRVLVRRYLYAYAYTSIVNRFPDEPKLAGGESEMESPNQHRPCTPGPTRPRANIGDRSLLTPPNARTHDAAQPVPVPSWKSLFKTNGQGEQQVRDSTKHCRRRRPRGALVSVALIMHIRKQKQTTAGAGACV